MATFPGWSPEIPQGDFASLFIRIHLPMASESRSCPGAEAADYGIKRVVFMGQGSLAWPIPFFWPPFFSPLHRAVTKVTETSTTGHVKSCLGRGEGLWEAVPVFSRPVWNDDGSSEVLSILEHSS